MNRKQKIRLSAINHLLAYLLPRLESAEDNRLSRDRTLNQYSYESGLSLRILQGYLDVLSAVGKLRQGGYVGAFTILLNEEG